jgi:hypothetical protein
VEVLKKAKDMQALLGIDEESLTSEGFSGEVHTPSYHLLSGDLRDVAALEASLKAAGPSAFVRMSDSTSHCVCCDRSGSEFTNAHPG